MLSRGNYDAITFHPTEQAATYIHWKCQSNAIKHKHTSTHNNSAKKRYTRVWLVSILWSLKQPMRVLNFYSLSFAFSFYSVLLSLFFLLIFWSPHSTLSEAGNMKKSQWVKGVRRRRRTSRFAEFSGLQSQHLFHPLRRNYVARVAS